MMNVFLLYLQNNIYLSATIYIYAFIIGKVVYTDKEFCTKYLIGTIYAILSKKIHSTPYLLFTLTKVESCTIWEISKIFA